MGVTSRATYEILPRLRITGGIRYTKDKINAFGSVGSETTPQVPLTVLPPSEDKQNRATFRVALDYQLSRDALLYASFNRGYLAGKYNILTYNPTPTKPEGIDAYEVGFKTDFLEHRLRVNGAAFYYKVISPQVQLQTSGTVIFSNAGGARVEGAEIDIQAVPTDGLNLRASATYLDSKYTNYGVVDPATGLCVRDCAPASMPDFVNGGAIGLPGINAAGNYTPNASKLTFDVGGDYRVRALGGELLFSADWYHNSGFFYEPDNLLHQGAYDLVNGQIRYKPDENLAFRVWGKNLLDKKYSNAGSTNVDPAGYQFHAAAPLTYGVAVDFSF